MTPISLQSCGRIQRPRLSLCRLLILEGRPRGTPPVLKGRDLAELGSLTSPCDAGPSFAHRTPARSLTFLSLWPPPQYIPFQNHQGFFPASCTLQWAFSTNLAL